MTPEIVRRVDAWLARRPGSALSRRWSALASTWADQQISALPEDAEASAAAMGGVLLALVREAWGHPHTNACRTSDGRYWGVRCPGFGGHMGTGNTEAEALVEALEAAP
jgi:hypothetical protein